MESTFPIFILLNSKKKEKFFLNFIKFSINEVLAIKTGRKRKRETKEK